MLLICAPAPAQEAAPLPDAEITQVGDLRAWLAGPTTLYRHGVLGDGIEALQIVVEQAGRRLVHDLQAAGERAVFEDRRVRLVDLDADGRPEALVVKSFLDRGAALAAFRIGPAALTPLAESSAIGTPNRWLNPTGVADFDGDGRVEIAAVVTPHLGGSLRFYRLDGARLVEIARHREAVTNHIIGSRDLDLGRLHTPSGRGAPLLVLPTLDRRALVAVGFESGALRTLARAQAPAPIARLGAITDGEAGTLVVSTTDERGHSVPLRLNLGR